MKSTFQTPIQDPNLPQADPALTSAVSYSTAFSLDAPLSLHSTISFMNQSQFYHLQGRQISLCTSCAELHPKVIEIVIKAPKSFVFNHEEPQLKFNPYNLDRFDPYLHDFLKECDEKEISFNDAITNFERQPTRLEVSSINVWLKQGNQKSSSGNLVKKTFDKWRDYDKFAEDLFSHLAECEVHQKPYKVYISQINLGTKQTWLMDKQHQFSHDPITRLEIESDFILNFDNQIVLAAALNNQQLKRCQFNASQIGVSKKKPNSFQHYQPEDQKFINSFQITPAKLFR